MCRDLYVLQYIFFWHNNDDSFNKTREWYYIGACVLVRMRVSVFAFVNFILIYVLFSWRIKMNYRTPYQVIAVGENSCEDIKQHYKSAVHITHAGASGMGKCQNMRGKCSGALSDGEFPEKNNSPKKCPMYTHNPNFRRFGG